MQKIASIFLFYFCFFSLHQVQAETNIKSLGTSRFIYSKDYWGTLTLFLQVAPLLEGTQTEITTPSAFLILGDYTWLEIEVLGKENDFYYQSAFVSTTDPSLIVVEKSTNNSLRFFLELKKPGEGRISFLYEKVARGFFNKNLAWVPNKTVASAIINLPIIGGNNDAGVREAFPEDLSVTTPEVKITSSNLKPGNRGRIDIEIFHIADDGQEINLDPIFLKLAPSILYNNTQVVLSVHHTILHSKWYFGSPTSHLFFTFDNKESVNNSSLMMVYDWVEEGENYLLIPCKKGKETLSFSCTKTTPGSYQGYWSYKQEPAKKATTIVHLPIEIIDEDHAAP